MALHAKPARRALLIAAVVVAISAIAILPARYAYIHYVLGEDVALVPGACITMPVAIVNNVAGEDFVVTYVNCDTLAKDEAINVYLLSKSTLGRLFHHKTLIFKYDPGMNDDAPLLASPRPNTVLISVPRISSIYSQTKRWDHLTFDYDILQIDYP